jgi:membrane fusion protein (multidrug efflux system)
MPPPAVTVVTLRTSPVELQRELPGLVSARLVAEVRPQVGGIVKRVLFTEGSYVAAGQQLYELDDAVYRVAQRSADANRMSAETALETARRSAERGAELLKAHMISVQDNDNLQTALHRAEADLATAQAAADSARINLDYAHISSPISGRIGKSAVTQGALVVANQPQALSTVQKLDTVYVDLTQSAGEWLQLQQELAAGGKGGGDSEVHIRLEDGSTYPLAGRLQFSDVTVEPGTGSFLLRVLVPNPKGLLLPGMYVRATIIEGTLASALLAPQAGITRDPKGNATAMVVGRDNKVELRNVVTARAVGDQWLVASGLSAGDRVIVEGLQKIQPGMPVQPAEPGAK